MIDKKNPWWMLVLLGVLAALLPVLAILQYRWIGAVSDGEQTRMQRLLQAGLLRFVDDFNRPLQRAQEAFLASPEAYLESVEMAPETVAAHLAEQYRQWQIDTRYPDLIEAVYWINYDADHTPGLHHLDTAAVALVPQTWPDALYRWQSFFRQAETLPASGRRPHHLTLEAAVPSTPPGLSIPLLPVLRPGSSLMPGQSSYLLLLLNQSYIAQTVFPSLAHAYFLDEDEATYDVLILHRDAPEQVVYRSTPTLTAADFNTPDAAADLGLASRIDVTTYLTDGEGGTKVMVQRQDSVDADVDIAMEVTRRAETILYEQEDVEDVMRTPSPRARQGSAPNRAGGVRLAKASGSVRPWRLLVRHKAGSIEAAIATVRRRTLGLGFGILLVLGGATVLLFISVRRARQLAEQQMAFVAGVTHELRTPLAVIRSAAENLADGVITDPEQARRYGTLIHTEGRRLSEIVEQALVLAGAHSNHAVLTLHPVAVTPLVKQALVRCRPILNERNTEVTLDLDDDLPRVCADAHALESALCNLVTNACKYGGAKGWIGLEARHIANRQASTVLLTVRDHGSGIPADELPHLFEPFFRGQAARQAQIRGSGLGLSLVKNTIEALGGRITVESVEGKGSAFTIHLPTILKREA